MIFRFAAASAIETALFPNFLSSGVVPCMTLEPVSRLCRPDGRETYMKRWRPIPGYEGLYEISDLGLVRSLKRTVMRSNGSPMSIPGRIRKTPPNRGYPTLVLHRGGFRENFAVHTLVALVFIGPRPPGTEVAHWDGDPSNPRLSNLRYATPIENDSDKIRHGTRSAGERNGRSRLKKSDIIEIRARVARGEMQGVVRRDFSISSGHISLIVNRKVWK